MANLTAGREVLAVRTGCQTSVEPIGQVFSSNAGQTIVGGSSRTGLAGGLASGADVSASVAVLSGPSRSVGAGGVAAVAVEKVLNPSHRLASTTGDSCRVGAGRASNRTHRAQPCASISVIARSAGSCALI